MVTTIINTHKVADFAKWKQGFEAGAAMREQLGIEIKSVYQSVDDENLVTIVSEVPNVAIARAIISDPGLKEAMEKSGAISAPEFKILNKAI